MTGNEAIAWAAKCLGVDIATGYPGLPCTSIINTLRDITTQEEMRVEWSGNEKIALETGYGVSVSGGRALVVQKMAGLNVCLDSLMIINLLGSAGGLVLAVGDVPGSIFSGNEQDSRILGAFAELPVFEPATSQEGFDFTVQAFLTSEKFGLPAVLRFTKGFALAKGPVKFACDLPKNEQVISDIRRSFAPAAKRVEAHGQLHAKQKQIRDYFSSLALNQVEDIGDKALITCGHTASKVRQALQGQRWPGTCKLIQLGTLHPLPEGFLVGQLQGVQEALVIEEVEPYLEEKLRNLVGQNSLPTAIYGKTTGNVQWEGELSLPHIERSLQWFLGPHRDTLPDFDRVEAAPVGNELPGFCDDCPYEYYFTELQEYLRERRIARPLYTGEPGCSIYLEAPPFQMLDVKVSLGSSVGVACGLALKQPDREVVAIVGDSAFFHSEIPSLLYASHSGADLIALILYNHTAGVTGRQPHPASGFDLRGTPREIIDIARIVEACRVPYVRTVQGRDLGELWEAWEEVFSRKGVRVLILDDACPLI